MKVLFIGGTGNISLASSELAIKKGYELYLLNRGVRNAKAPEGAKIVTADIHDEVAAAKALAGLSFDVVVDWIAFTPAHIERDIRLFGGKIKQYIFISSASVYQKPSANYLVDESAPLANPHWEYSRNKAACEERLLQEYRLTGFPYTVVRPSLTYGDTLIPASMNNWRCSYSLVDRMRKGKKVIVQGDGTSLWQITHNSDFAKGLVGLLDNKKALAHVFHITTDEVLYWDQIFHIIADAAGAKANIIHIPSDFITILGPGEEGNLIGDKSVSLVFDNAKIKAFVPEYQATVTFAQGVRRSMEWFDALPERRAVDRDWDAMCDNIITAYETGIEYAKKLRDGV